MQRRRLILTAIAAAAPLRAAVAGEALPARGLALVMVDRPGCGYCRAWKREILPGFASHPQGRAAPLTIVQMDGPWPDGLALARAPFFTPTFILLHDRAEVARLEGYPGKRHFWPEIDRMLATDAALRGAAL